MLTSIKKELTLLFKNNPNIRILEYHNEYKLLLLYNVILINNEYFQKEIIPILNYNDYQNRLINLKEIIKDEIVKEVLAGHLVIYDYKKKVFYSLDINKLPNRQVNESSIDITISGPKDALIENIDTNISLIQKRLKSENLIIENFTIGSTSKTKVSLTYLKDLPNPQVIKIIREKLSMANVESLLNIGEMEGLIMSQNALVPLLSYTSRSDFICESLTRKKVAIIIDGIPLALIAPSTFLFFLDFHDSLSENFFVILFDRFLFIMALFVSVVLTPLVLAVINYYPELLPLDLITTTINSRKGISFSFTTEIIISEIILQLFRIAGTRLPKGLNSSLLVIGSFLISRVIIDAGILSQEALFVSAMSVIASYVISSNFSFNTSINLFRWFLIILTIVFGLVGSAIGALLILVYLGTRESIIMPYLFPLAPFDKQEFKNIFIPANLLKRRVKHEKN